MKKEHRYKLVIFFNVCAIYQCRINNFIDKNWEPLPAGVIYYCVISVVNDYEYPPNGIYCEKFARWAKYDLSICKQENVGKALVIGGGNFSFKKILIIAVVTAVLGYFGNRSFKIKRIQFVEKIIHSGYKLYISF
uniref:Uncharacterized protein n=1 Tax=Strongyloides venezuelensis TaxID=75913 RepID=A0A0K0EUZ2_STRVS